MLFFPIPAMTATDALNACYYTFNIVMASGVHFTIAFSSSTTGNNEIKHREEEDRENRNTDYKCICMSAVSSSRQGLNTHVCRYIHTLPIRFSSKPPQCLLDCTHSWIYIEST